MSLFSVPIMVREICKEFYASILFIVCEGFKFIATIYDDGGMMDDFAGWIVMNGI